ncbi:MAG: hypothetical protein ALAOOOJD_03654 [bacterium]|nr:hypothetical protein [bacterium]
MAARIVSAHPVKICRVRLQIGINKTRLIDVDIRNLGVGGSAAFALDLETFLVRGVVYPCQRNLELIDRSGVQIIWRRRRGGQRHRARDVGITRITAIVVGAHAIKIFGIRAQTRVGIAFDVGADRGNLSVGFGRRSFAFDFEAAFIIGTVRPGQNNLAAIRRGGGQVTRRFWQNPQRFGARRIGII